LRFESIEEFAEWYNHRIHRSLWLKGGEKPEEAFLGLFMAQTERRTEYGLRQTKK